MVRQRQAKIVATVGPASAAPEMLERLVRTGVDVFRLNFSHGQREDHARTYENIRALEARLGYPIGVMQDLQGPKIRLGVLTDGKLAIAEGQKVEFALEREQAGRKAIPLPHPEIFAAIAPGHALLINDGRVRFEVESCRSDVIAARALNAGVISDRKGVNLPNTVLKLSPLTEKDRADLAFGLELGVDWIALSFVQTASDMLEARALIKDRAGLIAKIEKPSALAHIDDIIRLSEAVMIARGDLGVEIPAEDVPRWQKQLVRLCRRAATPVIVATQMLESMVSAPTPTRAEASDVATAVYDGADAVMLSAESATGSYPVEAVEIMNRIIARTEADEVYRKAMAVSELDLDDTPAHAIASSAAEIGNALDAGAIVAFTASGTTALRISRTRPHEPILAASPNRLVTRQLCLSWGVRSIHTPDVTSYEDMVHSAERLCAEQGVFEGKKPVVVVAGIPFGVAGSTNNIRVIGPAS